MTMLLASAAIVSLVILAWRSLAACERIEAQLTATVAEGTNDRAALAGLREQVKGLHAELRELHHDIGQLLETRFIERLLRLLERRLAKRDTPGQLARLFVREARQDAGKTILRGARAVADDDGLDDQDMAAVVATAFAEIEPPRAAEQLLLTGYRALGLTKAAAEALLPRNPG